MTTAEKERVVYRRGRDRDFTEEEYEQLSAEVRAAEERGDEEEHDRLFRMLPMEPSIVRACARAWGKQHILALGVDLTEANLKFGEGWLDEIPD